MPGEPETNDETTTGHAIESEINFEAFDTPGDDISLDNRCNIHSNTLPVVQFREEIISLIRSNQVVIIAGETGSGKTTQIPRFLAEDQLISPTKRLGITQPRRLAAMTLSQRVALEMNSKIGHKVGYSVRFDDCTSPHTEIQFLTDGLLLRKFLVDPMLSEYNAVMIDEAHERTLHTDIVLGLVRDIARQRPEFKIIISSATLNAAKFSSFFDNATVFNVPGRRFPVQVFYARHSQPEYIQAVVSTVFQVHISQPLGGDILVFLPGQEEIENVESRLVDYSVQLGSAAPELIAVPVFANMPPEQQARIFMHTPGNCRKVILATNIAETSLTIPDIAYVIDTGLAKEQSFNSHSGLDSLILQRCSKASANQRCGRAGRTGPGKCFRLYTKATFEHEMPAESIAEILRTNLSSVCLILLTLGVPNITEFTFLDKPADEALAAALTELYALGAINQACKLTRRGRILAEFPTSPQMARTLISSIEYGCVDAVSTVVAMLGELGNLYVRPKGRKTESDTAHAQMSVLGGDHQTLIHIYNQWEAAKYSPKWCRDHYIQLKALRRARDVKTQLKQLCNGISKRTVLKQNDIVQNGLQMSLVSGFFTRCARLSKTGQHYVVVGRSEPVYIHPGSMLWGKTPAPKLILYHELVLTSREYMRGCMELDPEFVKVVVPHFYYQRLEKREEVRI